jgi:hypothetical protein
MIEKNYNFLEVFDKNSVRYQSIGKFTGSNQTATLVSSSNSLTVSFKTDYSIVGKGFKLRYEIKRKCKWIFELHIFIVKKISKLKIFVLLFGAKAKWFNAFYFTFVFKSKYIFQFNFHFNVFNLVYRIEMWITFSKAFVFIVFLTNV